MIELQRQLVYKKIESVPIQKWWITAQAKAAAISQPQAV